MDKTCILIVDDNPEIREIINVLLGGEGFEVSEAENGAQALTLIEQQDFDLIILDIMMPGPNGYQTCRKIRELSNAPILFLSARTKESDKTLGFSSGGDDYLAKPFSYNELISRSKALIRRYQVYKGKNESGNQSINSASVNPTAEPIASTSNASDSRHRILLFHDLEINQTVREVHKNGQLLDLTETEYSMLELLVANRHQTFSAQRLFESVWQEPYYYGANNTVTVHIRNLRSKVEDNPGNPELIKTVWGKGHRCD